MGCSSHCMFMYIVVSCFQCIRGACVFSVSCIRIVDVALVQCGCVLNLTVQ